MNQSLFKSFFQGGFECSTHRRFDGKRVDVIASTGHDRLAEIDYRLLAGCGVRTVRDGVRWHLIEQQPYQYDWSSVLPQVLKAAEVGTEVIWDMFHYGWPDGLDIWSAAFVDRFAAFAGSFARMLVDTTGSGHFYTPVNEISFMAFAAGEHGFFYPYGRGRGGEMKRQLVRAYLAAAEAIREADPGARLVAADPMINVTAKDPFGAEQARRVHASQYEAWDMIIGAAAPELGGDPVYLDIVGVNYYAQNQWTHEGQRIVWTDSTYRPFHEMLAENHARYRRPLLIAETGIENEERAPWFSMVCKEALQALRLGLPLHGVCLYPIMNHPGWDDDRHCANGLIDYRDDDGARSLYEPLARELAHQQTKLMCEASITADLNDNGALSMVS